MSLRQFLHHNQMILAEAQLLYFLSFLTSKTNVKFFFFQRQSCQMHCFLVQAHDCSLPFLETAVHLLRINTHRHNPIKIYCFLDTFFTFKSTFNSPFLHLWLLHHYLLKYKMRCQWMLQSPCCNRSGSSRFHRTAASLLLYLA